MFRSLVSVSFIQLILHGIVENENSPINPKKLIALRSHPEPDEGVFAEAATLLRVANDLAVVQGIKIDPVRGAL